MQTIDWEQKHILHIANEVPENSDKPDEKELRTVIEPWLTAVFQSEHLSLLTGTGLTTGICYEAGVIPKLWGELISISVTKRYINMQILQQKIFHVEQLILRTIYEQQSNYSKD